MQPKVVLCIPPDYDTSYPPLATPALCGFLKNKGIAAEQVDLNLAYRDFLADHIAAPELSVPEKRLILRDVLRDFFRQSLRDRYYSGFFPPADIPQRRMPYNNYSNSSYYFAERLLVSELLFRYLDDEKENTFLQFYIQRRIVDFLKHSEATVLGISIIAPGQAVAAFTLGRLVKKNLPSIHVTIGGQWPTLYRSQLRARKDLFRCFDSIIVFEGETPLYELARALGNGRMPAHPNIITQKTEAAVVHFYQGEDLNLLPCPDFSGLSLDQYSQSGGGRIDLTYETSRGCYWARCAYCVDLPLPKPVYRKKDARLVARDIGELKEKYHALNLMLGDPGMSPRQMREVSEAILRKKIGIDWWCMARLDPGFSHELFLLARAAGLRQINFGFESANDRVCDFLDKGNKRARSARVIEDCFRAGIRVDLQTMLGLPGESFTEGLDTVDFLVSHWQAISHVSFNVYYLTPSNHIYLDPEKYGIQYEKNGESAFRFFIPFQNVRGMSVEDAERLEDMYDALLARKKPQTHAGCETGYVSSGEIGFSLNGESITARYALPENQSATV